MRLNGTLACLTHQSGKVHPNADGSLCLQAMGLGILVQTLQKRYRRVDMTKGLEGLGRLVALLARVDRTPYVMQEREIAMMTTSITTLILAACSL